MSDIKVMKDSKLIKVLAAQARNERLDSAIVDEANSIITELAENMSPENRHQIAQTVAYTVTELQQGSLDFLSNIADVKNIGYGDKAAFNLKTRGVKAYMQAKGSTTPRSFVAGKQLLVETDEISARPAINVLDLRAGRVNMADLIREANTEMTNLKIGKIEGVLHAAVSSFSTPLYATSTTTLSKAALDAQLTYFRRMGAVTILGDYAAVNRLFGLTGMQLSDSMKDEYNNNGYLGRYNGCAVVAMNNAYAAGSTTPILKDNWLYLIPGGLSADMKNLKVVNEGSVNAFEAQDINDLVYEIRLDQAFGAAFIKGEVPTIGAHQILP